MSRPFLCISNVILNQRFLLKIECFTLFFYLFFFIAQSILLYLILRSPFFYWIHFTNKNRNYSSDQEVQQKLESYVQFNNIDVIPHGELRYYLVVTQLEPKQPIEPKRKNVNMTQPLYGLPHGFLPPPRVKLAGSMCLMDLRELIIGELAVQDLSIWTLKMWSWINT